MNQSTDGTDPTLRPLKRKQQVLQVLDQLRDEIKHSGHGKVGEIETTLGRSAGWLSRRRRSAAVELGQVFEVLDVLELDPGRFFRRVFGSPTGMDLDPPRGKPPALVLRAWQRFQQERPQDPGRESLPADFVATLDWERYASPREVLHQIGWAVERVVIDQLPDLLGVAGSVWRLLGVPEKAEHALHAAITMNLEREAPATFGNLLLRLSCVLADRAEYEEALQLTERATQVHVRSHDAAAIGQSLVNQGYCLSYLGRLTEAVSTLHAALGYLPEVEVRPRFSALQLLAAADLERGEVESAGRHLALAETLLDEVHMGALPAAKLLWLKARIALERGAYEEADACLRQAIELFRPLYPAEAALATTELVRVQFLRGRPADAYRISRTMYQLVEPLHSNRLISAALAEILRVEASGLDLALVERAKLTIERAKERPRSSPRFQVF